jgi:DNA-directed RNA polymerase specialized sigma24 family protein
MPFARAIKPPTALTELFRSRLSLRLCAATPSRRREEVAQETFVAVFRSIDAFVGRSALLSWIYGIAKNTVNNHLRRTRAQELRISSARAELVRNAHLRGVFAGRACELPPLRVPRCGASNRSGVAGRGLALRHFENLPIQDIADRMSRSNDAIRSSLFRVKRLIVEAVGSVRALTERKPGGG